MSKANVEGRRYWLQEEVIDIGKYLFTNFKRSNLFYWKSQGVFDKPYAQTPRMVLYSTDYVVNCFLQIASRLRKPVTITDVDIENAMKVVLKKNKFKVAEILSKIS